MEEQTDQIWKALSDPTRRSILDALRKGPRTTTEIVEAFPDMTRHAVMKHIDVLRGASLINTRQDLTKDGRRRENTLNPVPIRQIHNRWIDKYTERQVSALADLKSELEETA